MKILFHTRGFRWLLSKLGVDDHESEAETQIVYPTFETRESNGETWLHIVDGSVTGYESISIKDLLAHGDWSKGWSACAGTKGRWDSLRIDGKDMKALQEYFMEQQRLMEADGGSLI